MMLKGIVGVASVLEAGREDPAPRGCVSPSRSTFFFEPDSGVGGQADRSRGVPLIACWICPKIESAPPLEFPDEWASYESNEISKQVITKGWVGCAIIGRGLRQS